jgi:hypothetical protein
VAGESDRSIGMCPVALIGAALPSAPSTGVYVWVPMSIATARLISPTSTVGNVGALAAAAGDDRNAGAGAVTESKVVGEEATWALQVRS